MESLAEIYKRHCILGVDSGHGDKGGTHSYIEEYEELLTPYRTPGTVFMEIGLAMGLSIAMWREYMPDALLIGVDLSFPFDSAAMEQKGVVFIAADATKPEFAKRMSHWTFDVIIDDASHMADAQRATFKMMAPLMRRGGIYIIEDILDLNRERRSFLGLHPNCEIRDLRSRKGRFDDVLVIYRFE